MCPRLVVIGVFGIDRKPVAKGAVEVGEGNLHDLAWGLTASRGQALDDALIAGSKSELRGWCWHESDDASLDVIMDADLTLQPFTRQKRSTVV